VAQEQKFAELGEFKLVSGEVIHDCRIGYRTFGERRPETMASAQPLVLLAFGTISLDLIGFWAVD
jgi:homoserine acetyltransferase